MKKNPNARITRVHNSWRVRVFGHPPAFFSPTEYGGEDAALEAARAWRDAHWDGKDLNRKLSDEQIATIRRSSAHYKILAERYGVTPNYIHYLWRTRPNA